MNELTPMNTNDIMSQIEMNKTIIQRYFDAYNNKNETIFDEIISSIDLITNQLVGVRGNIFKSLDRTIRRR